LNFVSITLKLQLHNLVNYTSFTPAVYNVSLHPDVHILNSKTFSGSVYGEVIINLLNFHLLKELLPAIRSIADDVYTFQSASTHLDCLLGLYWTGLTLLNGFPFFLIFFFLFWVVR